MATFSTCPLPLPSLRCSSLRRRLLPTLATSPCAYSRYFGQSPSLRARVFASSSSSSDWGSNENPRSKKSVLFNLIQEIEPLDVSLIQKDVPPTTVDAMKRTISGMLGLLPSDQFQVVIEALWEPLFKLLISSIMTGYTLRNAEYRLCLERNVEICEGHVESDTEESSKLEMGETRLRKIGRNRRSRQEKSPTSATTTDIVSDIPDFGEMTPEAREYILKLHSHLSSAKKELHEAKRKTAALQMQQFVGEEKNELLDYLRSSQPETVAELSEPTCPDLKETVHSVVHGLLATLSPKMHSKGADLVQSNYTGILNVENEGHCVDLVENGSLQFQPLISLPRDYLARLLFWLVYLLPKYIPYQNDAVFIVLQLLALFIKRQVTGKDARLAVLAKTRNVVKSQSSSKLFKKSVTSYMAPHNLLPRTSCINFPPFASQPMYSHTWVSWLWR